MHGNITWVGHLCIVWSLHPIHSLSPALRFVQQTTCISMADPSQQRMHMMDACAVQNERPQPCTS
jgi:hypothetical protein